MPQLNRKDIIGFMDTYVDALAASDAKRLPVHGFAKFTEQAKELKLGEGLWQKKVTRVPGGQYFADPLTSQVCHFNALKIDGADALIWIRLKIGDAKIYEIETLIVPENKFMFNAAVASEPHAVWNEVLPEQQRRPREELFRIMNLYMEGIEQVTARFIPVSKEAFRLENGTRAANNPNPPAHMPDYMVTIMKEGVAEQLDNRRHTYIKAIRERRFILADEERGIGFGCFLFDQPGRREDGSDTLVGRSTMIIPEAFKIVDGIIQQVEAVGTGFPYGAQSGWAWSYERP